MQGVFGTHLHAGARNEGQLDSAAETLVLLGVVVLETDLELDGLSELAGLGPSPLQDGCARKARQSMGSRHIFSRSEALTDGYPGTPQTRAAPTHWRHPRGERRRSTSTFLLLVGERGRSWCGQAGL